MSKHFTMEYFEFFIELTLNNSKTWFDENRARYEKIVRPQFIKFAQELKSELVKINADFEQMDVKKSMFRINRDIRFSKDKTPYKTSLSAIFSPYGNKSMKPHGLYVEMGPEKCGLYSGLYMPDKDELSAIRGKIFEESEQFNSIISQQDFIQYFGEVKGEKNKRIDKQWMAKAEDQPYLLNKQFYITHSLEPENCLEETFIEQCLKVYHAAKPLNDFLTIA